MCEAIEILKDGSQIVYVSDDIETYDDLYCDSNPELPPLDLTKVKSYDIFTERTESEVVYKQIYSGTNGYVHGKFIGARTTTSEPITIQHTDYYVYLKFEGERRKRKFIVDGSILQKIDEIQEDREFLNKYEPTYHPSLEEIRKEQEEERAKKWGCFVIIGFLLLILCMIFGSK